PGVGLVFGVGMAECASWMTRRFRERRFLSALAGSVLSVGFLTAAVALVAIQVRTYLLVPPEGLTRYKSGLQWVADRQIGQALAPRAAVWDHPTLYVWGWQSPLYFYSGMDCPTRHFFPNDWILGQVGKRNPLVDRFLAETMHDLKANPPNLIFLGTRPFPELGNFVQERYVPSRLLEEGPFPLLWVRREDAETFNRGIPR
ncbi:MAG TPA: hypothetical protein VFT74_02035, partial [Isosphaeraceae bacterium]|nr:hypothetical protein [Isosphaeraceae bacterium]